MSARHPAQNKQWYPERFQAVVDALQKEAEFIQLGSDEDPPLANVTDLRGATTIRQSAAILYQARLHLGHEGFLMHLARAVECPSVIVFGGRVAPRPNRIYLQYQSLFRVVLRAVLADEHLRF